MHAYAGGLNNSCYDLSDPSKYHLNDIIVDALTKLASSLLSNATEKLHLCFDSF